MEIDTELERVLARSSIFDEIPRDKYENVLRCLCAGIKGFRKDENILNIGEYSHMSGIVIRGRVELSFFDENGNQISVNHIGPGEVFGAERACCGWAPSPIRLCAVTDCSLLFLDFSVLLRVENTGCPYRARVTANLLRDFARQTQFLNLKLRILAQKRLRDKLKVYLQTLRPAEDGSILLPFNRRELAEFLYVDRSALSRELSHMQEEGILTYSGRRVTIQREDFLKY